MNNYKKLSRVEDRLPTNYEFQKILYNRRDPKAENKEQEYSFRRARKGVEGEEKVVAYLRKYGGKDWVILRNIWLNEMGVFECDVLVLTGSGCYVIEVKNYEGYFSYENGICRLNNQEIGSNCVTQVRRARLNVENLFRQRNIACKPEGVLIFVGENNPVEIREDIKDIQIVMRSELKFFVQRLLREDRNRRKRLDVRKIIECLEFYKTDNPFLPKPVSEEELKGLRKGIYCKGCGSFEVILGRKYLSCTCGVRENREVAIMRTICEYGVLRYESDLKVSALSEFFSKQVSRASLQRVLRKKFEMVNKSRYSYYRNKKLPYEEIF